MGADDQSLSSCPASFRSSSGGPDASPECGVRPNLRQATRAANGQTLDDLRGAVAQSYGLDREALLHRSRLSEVADARKVLAYVGHRELGFTVAEIGRYLSISGPAVSQMLRDGGRLAKDRRILFL